MKETIYYLKKVYAFGRKYRVALFLEFFTTIVQIIIGIILPLFLAKQIVFFTENVYKQIVLVSLVVFSIEMINELNIVLMRRCCQVFRRGTIKNIQIALGTEILKICQSDIEKYGTGTFIERLTQDVDQMTEIFTTGVGYFSGVIINIGIFIAIFIINKIVFIYYFIVAIILTLLYLIKTKKTGFQDMQCRKQKEIVSGLIGELIRGEKDIKMLSAKKSFMDKLSLEIIKRNDRYHDIATVKMVYGFIVGTATHIFEFLLVILLVSLIKYNVISAAIAVVLFTYKTNIMSNLMEKVSLLLDEVKNFNISANRVFSILDNKEFQKEHFGKKHINKIRGNFAFENVYFSYEDKQVLKGLSFKIKENETVAFVGKSGAGKTTIFSLLCKLYDIQDGNILLDGKNIKELDEYSIRDNITIISQNPYIFNLSIRDNLKLVKENLTDEEMKDACKMACLTDFIEELPNKYDTIVGEGGVNLSGGQRQRLAIARAFVQNTKIILFDEATSALDNETQKYIQQAINNMKEKYTILIIAHRLSTIVGADRIMLVEDGKITATGTHKKLLSENKTYKKLYENEILEK